MASSCLPSWTPLSAQSEASLYVMMRYCSSGTEVVLCKLGPGQLGRPTVRTEKVANWAPGPSCPGSNYPPPKSGKFGPGPGPNCPPLKNGKLGPGQMAPGSSCPRPNCPPPKTGKLGPTVRGPICPEPLSCQPAPTFEFFTQPTPQCHNIPSKLFQHHQSIKHRHIKGLVYKKYIKA